MTKDEALGVLVWAFALVFIVVTVVAMVLDRKERKP